MAGARHPRKPKAAPSAAQELRRQAEERFEGLPAAAAAAAAAMTSPLNEDSAAVLHELLVHQIELEMQNEELRRIQLELDGQREKYFELFDLAPVGYLTLSDRGIVGDANFTAARLLGVDRKLLVGQPFSVYVLSADRDAFYLHQRKIRRTGSPGTCEVRLRRLVAHEDGPAAPTYFFAHVEGRLRSAEGSEVPPLWVTFTDVSEAIEARETLRESQRFVTSILDTSPNLIYIYDSIEGRNVYANQEVSRYLGYTPEQIEAFGSSLFERILHPDDAAAVAAHHTRLESASDDDVFEIEYRMKHADGEWSWLRSRDRVFARDAEGRLTRIIGFTEDISGRKQSEAEILRLNTSLEERIRQRTQELQATNKRLSSANQALGKTNLELEEATRAKSEFLAAMSHELRTPLNSIIGFSGVLSQELAGSLNGEQRRQIGMINNSGRHLLELINEVLDLAKVEAGEKRPGLRKTDIRAIARQTIETVRPMADAKSIDVRLECPAGLASIRTDGHYINQILLNLLGNAVKFTDAGCVTTIVSQDETGVTIAVEDTGLGIAPADLERVFDDFYQAVPVNGGKSEGTGLGLAVSRRLGESIGARIEVASELGRGSLFTLRIPDLPR